mgnify:CR=1 FL=1
MVQFSFNVLAVWWFFFKFNIFLHNHFIFKPNSHILGKNFKFWNSENFEFWPKLKTETEPQNRDFNGLFFLNDSV